MAHPEQNTLQDELLIRRLIERWSSAAQIDTALATSQPHFHCEAIAEALSTGADVPESLIEMKSCNPCNESPVRATGVSS